MTSQTTAQGAPIGTWLLQSYTREDMENGAKENQFGARPNGYIIYTPEGRMSALFVKDGRAMPATAMPSDPERADLHKGMIAYGGRYAVEGDIVRHFIETSWNQVWTGTTLTRRFRVESNVLTITTLPSPNPVDGKMSSSVLVWHRAPA